MQRLLQLRLACHASGLPIASDLPAGALRRKKDITHTLKLAMRHYVNSVSDQRSVASPQARIAANHFHYQADTTCACYLGKQQLQPLQVKAAAEPAEL